MTPQEIVAVKNRCFSFLSNLPVRDWTPGDAALIVTLANDPDVDTNSELMLRPGSCRPGKVDVYAARADVGRSHLYGA